MGSLFMFALTAVAILTALVGLANAMPGENRSGSVALILFGISSITGATVVVSLYEHLAR